MTQPKIEFIAMAKLLECPRQNLFNVDLRAYTNEELLNFIIGSLGSNVLTSVDQSLIDLGEKSVFDLMKIKGIGRNKALKIMATIELGRRRHAERIIARKKVTNSHDVFMYFYPLIAELPMKSFGCCV